MKTIEEVATEFDVSHRTLRFWESKGLCKPERTKTSRRLYSEADTERISQLMKYRNMGFQINEIREIINSGFNPIIIRTLAQIRMAGHREMQADILTKIQALKEVLK